MNIIPVITLKQPWASWVMDGLKTIETRTHKMFRILEGKEIGIHAGLAVDNSDNVVQNPYIDKQILIDSMHCPSGGLLGTINCYKWRELNETHSKAALINCNHTTRYGNLLINPKPFDKLIPVKGELGIWYFDLDTMQKVKKPV